MKKKIQIIIIIMITILAMFNIFILTLVTNKDYTSFAVLDGENIDKLDPELENVLLAMKTCDELKNSQEQLCYPSYLYGDIQNAKICVGIREYCYYGVIAGLGYKTLDINLCNKLKKYNKKRCYYAIAKIIGQGNDTRRFEDYLQICEGEPLCLYHLFQGKSDPKECEEIDKEYKLYCYYGIGHNLLLNYELEEAIEKCRNYEDYLPSCIYGLSSKAGKLKIPIIDSLDKILYYSGFGLALESESAFKTCEEISEIELNTKLCRFMASYSIGLDAFKKLG